MKVLVAFDGSPYSEAAVNDLLNAGIPDGAEIRIITAPEIWMLDLPETAMAGAAGHAERNGKEPEMPPMGYLEQISLEEAHEIARKGAALVSGLGRSWGISHEVCPASPSEGILAAVEDWHPDLVILGTHSRSLLGRVLLGSVALKVLYNAFCSVRIARRRPTSTGAPLRLLIGVDATPGSAAAVDAVIGRRWPEGTTARVVSVVEPPSVTIVPVLAFDVTQWMASQQEGLKELQERAAHSALERLRNSGMEASMELFRGSAVTLLLDQAREWGADSIFLAATQHGFLERALVGSVSSGVAARAHCSVEVVRPAYREEG